MVDRYVVNVFYENRHICSNILLNHQSGTVISYNRLNCYTIVVNGYVYAPKLMTIPHYTIVSSHIGLQTLKRLIIKP